MTNRSVKKFVSDLIEISIGTPLIPVRKHLSLADIAGGFSPAIDRIINSRKRDGENFFAGKCSIVALKNRTFIVNYELCFEDDAGRINMFSKIENPRSAWIWLSDEAWSELVAVHEKVFEIVEPAEI